MWDTVQSTEAVNPTYSWKFNENNREITLVSKQDARYTYEEYDYRSVEEARRKFPIYRNGIASYYERELERLTLELNRARNHLRAIRNSEVPNVQ